MSFYIFTNNYFYIKRVVFKFRLAWIVCVITAIILFTYQVVERTIDYRKHNTTVSVGIRYTDSVAYPTVTLCDTNSFRYVPYDITLNSWYRPALIHIRLSQWGSPWLPDITLHVAVNREYDTCFGKGLVTGYAGYEYWKGLIETSK